MSRRGVEHWDHGLPPKRRDLGVSDLPMFQGETGITPPTPAEQRAHEKAAEQAKRRIYGG